MKKSIVLVLYLISLLVSCRNSTAEEVADLLHRWNGKEIHFPKRMNLISYVDTNKTVVFDDWKAKYTILHYVDTIGCVSCKLQLSKWKKLVEELDSISNFETKCLIYFSPINKKSLLKSLRINKFKHYVCIDEKDSLNLLNKLPQNEAFHTFLLDQENKVRAVGNPVHNPKVKELYLKIIRGETVSQEEETSRAQTTVEADRTEADMGRFDWREEQTAEFVLKNTGRHPLVIFDTYASCGCTRVEYDGKPARPGDSLVLRVTYKADSPGHFRKEVTVRCNAEDEQLKLTVTGEAEEK